MFAVAPDEHFNPDFDFILCFPIVFPLPFHLRADHVVEEVFVEGTLPEEGGFVAQGLHGISLDPPANSPAVGDISRADPAAVFPFVKQLRNEADHGGGRPSIAPAVFAKEIAVGIPRITLIVVLLLFVPFPGKGLPEKPAVHPVVGGKSGEKSDPLVIVPEYLALRIEGPPVSVMIDGGPLGVDKCLGRPIRLYADRSIPIICADTGLFRLGSLVSAF